VYLTNVRLAWFAINNEAFNISIPWICIKAIKRKDVKGVPSMIVETKGQAGGYIVGYRGPDVEKVLVEASKMLQFFIESPVLGVEMEFSDMSLRRSPSTAITQFDEDVEIVDHGYNEMASKQYAIS
jgi:hypothetical protein